MPKEGTSRGELRGVLDTPKILPFNRLATGSSGPQQTTVFTNSELEGQTLAANTPGHNVPLPTSSVSIPSAGFPPPFIPPFIQQAFAEHLLCAKHCAEAAAY